MEWAPCDRRSRSRSRSLRKSSQGAVELRMGSRDGLVGLVGLVWECQLPSMWEVPPTGSAGTIVSRFTLVLDLQKYLLVLLVIRMEDRRD